MNDIELTQLFIDYAKCKAQLETLAMYIEEEVKQKGETVKVAGVTATYYKPTMEVDYEQAARVTIPADFDLLPFTTIKTVVRWKDVCETSKADTGLFITEKPARVVIK